MKLKFIEQAIRDLAELGERAGALSHRQSRSASAGCHEFIAAAVRRTQGALADQVFEIRRKPRLLEGQQPNRVDTVGDQAGER
jgi:hypothetical protein